MSDKAYKELQTRIYEASLLGSTAGILGWDQETGMPPGGVEHRGKQLGQLARMTHEMTTTAAVGDLISECEGASDNDEFSDRTANLRELRHSYDRATKLPSDLVEAMTAHTSSAQHAWAEARGKDDFDAFLPYLKKSLAFARTVANHYGIPEGGEIWDALADGFERGMTAENVEAVFTPLRERLVSLIDRIAGSSFKPNAELNDVELPRDQQVAFLTKVVEKIGFDLQRGRIDASTHPFCGGSHTNDVRMTVRYRDNEFLDALGGGMHEAGHGMYEQNIPYENFGMPLGNAIGLAMHESQSRMWENQVGRSLEFWQWAAPQLASVFGSLVDGIDAQKAYETANLVRPSLIRVEADEATYNLHVMIRFELERVLLNGDLQVDDLPGEWNAKYKEYLGIDVPNNQKGCLQDIHWSMGAFGYFPTYTLGNLYAAQLFATARSQLGDLSQDFAKGEFSALRVWLTENVHQHGSRYPSEVLLERVTGSKLDATHLVDYLEQKLGTLYGV